MIDSPVVVPFSSRGGELSRKEGTNDHVSVHDMTAPESLRGIHEQLNKVVKLLALMCNVDPEDV